MDEKIALLQDRLREAMDAKSKKAAEVSRALNIPKSAISQYLSGSSKNMDSSRLYAICKYLDVSEAWLMGFDVPMARQKEAVVEIVGCTNPNRGNIAPLERQLLLLIDELNEEGQQKVVDYASDLVAGGRYPKNRELDIPESV